MFMDVACKLWIENESDNMHAHALVELKSLETSWMVEPEFLAYKFLKSIVP